MVKYINDFINGCTISIKNVHMPLREVVPSCDMEGMDLDKIGIT